jgi:hypothetical protein
MDAASPNDPQSLNMYSYCGNDPINHIDPEGLFFGKLLKWIGKALKILSIVALVVMTIIIFAPASSFIFEAALWMFSNALLPLSQVPFLGAFVPLGSLGSPQWNPKSRGPFGNSFQGQSSTCPPDCQNEITLPPISAGTIYAHSSLWRRIYGGLRTAANLTAGMIDEGIIFGRYYRWGVERALGGPPADENSTSYSVGWYGALAGETVIGIFTGATEVKAAGWGIRGLRYPNAGGGGINLYRLGVRRFALDWHTIKSVGPRKVLHWHWGATKKAMKIHRGFWTGRAL